jgi:hypothetical protein
MRRFCIIACGVLLMSLAGCQTDTETFGIGGSAPPESARGQAVVYTHPGPLQSPNNNASTATSTSTTNPGDQPQNR